MPTIIAVYRKVTSSAVYRKNGENVNSIDTLFFSAYNFCTVLYVFIVSNGERSVCIFVMYPSSMPCVCNEQNERTLAQKNMECSDDSIPHHINGIHECIHTRRRYRVLSNRSHAHILKYNIAAMIDSVNSTL